MATRESVAYKKTARRKRCEWNGIMRTETQYLREQSMKKILVSLFVTVLNLPSVAIAAAEECAMARDPVRCEARQAAIKTCADKRGAAKTSCLEANMPPIDCTQHSNPAKCEATERAKEICRDKTGAQQKHCLKGEATKAKQTKKSAKKATKKAKKKKRQAA